MAAPGPGREPPAALGPADAEGAPRLVTRGESSNTPQPLNGGERYRLVVGPHGKSRIEITPLPKDGVHPFAALTDWINVTFPFESPNQSILGLFRGIEVHISNRLGGLADRNRGLHGYHHSFAFDNGSALFAYGGQRGTGFLSFPGEACALIPDWEKAYRYLWDTLKARITRWDGAVDDFEGRYTVDMALEWYLCGRFGTGGNKPSMRQAGNWAEPDGSGRTLYIGKGKHGKMLRVYEKGKQLGDKGSPWVRWELQLGNRDRVIPLEVLLNPGPYVAGAYECLDWITEEASRIKTINKTAEISYDHLVRYARSAYGSLLRVMREVEGGADAVLDKLVMPGLPKRLRLPIPDEDSLPEGPTCEP